MSTISPLEIVATRAGAFMVGSGDSRAASHYGSPAGELAVCLRTVGLADRSELGKYVVTGHAAAVTEVVRRVTGAALAPSGVAESAGAWWCAQEAGSVLVLCEPARRVRMLELVRMAARPLGQANVQDVSGRLSAIALLGPRTLEVLRCFDALGPADDPRMAPPFARFRCGEVDAQRLLQSDHCALLVCASSDADRLWRALAQAGRAFGMSCVGKQAIERLALIDRRGGRLTAVH